MLLDDCRHRYTVPNDIAFLLLLNGLQVPNPVFFIYASPMCPLEDVRHNTYLICLPLSRSWAPMSPLRISNPDCHFTLFFFIQNQSLCVCLISYA